MFGTELVIGKKHTFHQGAKVAIFTYQGCVLSLTGTPDVCYVARETPMIQYLNTHSAIEQFRTTAEEEGTTGPITMICGPNDVGKSTLCRILLNYAVRLGHRPIFSDIDVGQGQISIPGTMSSLLIERPASIEEGFSQQAPMVVHFGHKAPSFNLDLYKMCVETLANITMQRLKEDKRTNASGVIINSVNLILSFLSLLFHIKY
jgi:polyribonucleotide 5'-hydroxyl-kinase